MATCGYNFANGKTPRVFLKVATVMLGKPLGSAMEAKMAKKIGVRELKNNASKIVRAVREEGAEYVVTVHGEPVAVIRPLTEEQEQQELNAEIAAEIAEMKQLAKEIAAGWKSEKSGLEILEEDRQASFERLL